MVRREKSDGAQLHVLEGVAASVILVLAVTYAFNAFVVPPTGGVNPGVDTNQRIAEDLLTATASNGNLTEAIHHWNDTSGQFVNSSDGTYYYESEDPDDGHLNFGNYTNEAFSQQGLAYNIELAFSKDNGSETGTLTMVDHGEPGPSAVTASRTVTLDDEDNVTDVTSPSGNVTLENSTKYPIPKDGEAIYNRVEVRVTVW
jgi:hypothetical protein